MFSFRVTTNGWGDAIFVGSKLLLFSVVEGCGGFYSFDDWFPSDQIAPDNKS